jgi:monofunctional biosynthetic peptidoglycan transglycosylase
MMLTKIKRKISQLFKKMFKLLLFALFVLFVFYQTIQINIPDIEFLKHRNPSISNYMIADDTSTRDQEQNSVSYVEFFRISGELMKAVLVAEDDRFFEHHGFNWDEFLKSLQLNYKKKKFVRGGSTITQQLARNLFLSKDKSVLRKLKEWILTYKLERLLSKQRILELYLNFAEFGPGIYGVQAASKYHFNTTPRSLTRSQAAMLASMLPNPKVYGKKPYPGITYRRQKKILNRMNWYAIDIPKNTMTQKTPPQSVSKKINEVEAEILVPEDIDDELEFEDDLEFDEAPPEEVFIDE